MLLARRQDVSTKAAETNYRGYGEEVRSGSGRPVSLSNELLPWRGGRIGGQLMLRKFLINVIRSKVDPEIWSSK